MLAKSRVIKHISSLGFLTLLLISCGTSSNTPKDESSDTVRLTFVESDHFNFGTKRYDVKKGENFLIRLAPPYRIAHMMIGISTRLPKSSRFMT